MYACMFSLVDLHPAQSEWGGGRGCQCCLSAICAVAMYTCKCALCVCVPAGDTSSAFIRVGPGDMGISLTFLRLLDSV